jgi:hypothetical protein
LTIPRNFLLRARFRGDDANFVLSPNSRVTTDHARRPIPKFRHSCESGNPVSFALPQLSKKKRRAAPFFVTNDDRATAAP